MNKNRYFLRPAADRDVDSQAYYYATAANSRLGHRFLVAAHDTFALLSTQPEMGWRPRLRSPRLTDLRVFRVKGFEKILVLYLPHADGIEILRVVHGSRNLQTWLRREGF